MFKFKLKNGSTIDATNKSVKIAKNAINDNELTLTGEVIQDSTNLIRFSLKSVKSIVTDDGEIVADDLDIDTGDPYHVLDKIKPLYEKYSINDTEPEPEKVLEEYHDEVINEPTLERRRVTVTYYVDNDVWWTETGFEGDQYKMMLPQSDDTREFKGWNPSDNHQTFPPCDTEYHAIFERIGLVEQQ